MRTAGSFIEQVPIFINVRDRLSCLVQLTDWLARAGHRNVVLIDNGSTYPPLVDFLHSCPFRVVHVGRNRDHTVLWQLPLLRPLLKKGMFVYTDPDVVPPEACPMDLVVKLRTVLEQFPFYLKAGPGLRISDIPDHYFWKGRVIEWETRLYGDELLPGVFEGDIDTTFALYRAGSPYTTAPALRITGIYEIRHLPWYADSRHPDHEELYYRAHLRSGTTNWNIDSNKKSPQRESTCVTSSITHDPQAYLQTLLRSKTGRMMRVVRLFHRLFHGLFHPMVQRGSISYGTHATPSTDAQQAITTLLTSDEWHTAWRIMEPVRRLARGNLPLPGIFRQHSAPHRFSGMNEGGAFTPDGKAE